jgi:uncharacterized membrane protein YkvA (DUF1232 family)
MKKLSAKIKQWAKALKRQTLALYLAARHPATPWYAKAMAGLVAAYALSPIDLIPDFIPILGYLDDMILLPLGIWLTIRMVPKDIWTECREKAETMAEVKGPRWMTAVIIVVWGILLLAAIFFVFNLS